jgi:hypothetical protein
VNDEWFSAGEGNNVVALASGGAGGQPLLEFIHIEVLPFLSCFVLLGQQGTDQARNVSLFNLGGVIMNACHVGNRAMAIVPARRGQRLLRD